MLFLYEQITKYKYCKQFYDIFFRTMRAKIVARRKKNTVKNGFSEHYSNIAAPEIIRVHM